MSAVWPQSWRARAWWLFLVSIAVISDHASGKLLDGVSGSEVQAVRQRLEDQKGQFLLLQNDLEMVILKVAQLQRRVGFSESDTDHPLAIAYRLQELSEEIDRVKQTVHVLNSVTRSGYGVTYIRWGRTTCPGNGTEFVYAGFAGGSHNSHSGAAADFLCLADQPLWDHFEEAEQSTGALVYGAEYELSGRTRENFFNGKNPLDYDVPCVVCRAPRSSVLMIPGRNRCYGDDWNLEYAGYLSAGHYNHAAASQFVCLDKELEYLEGGSPSNDGKLFYTAEARCGSLKCPPYIKGRELTCVVCTK